VLQLLLFLVGIPFLCGYTSGQTGSVGGYPGANALCRSACGLSNAHVCRGSEILQAAEQRLNVNTMTVAWYAAGSYASWSTSGEAITDCSGFTSNSATVHGALWGAGSPAYPSVGTCSNPAPIACCAYSATN
jgi:hypothetical protein